MTGFTDKMEAAGIDLETAKQWEKDLRDKLEKAKTRLRSATGAMTNAATEKATASDEIARLSATLGIPGEV